MTDPIEDAKRDYVMGAIDVVELEQRVSYYLDPTSVELHPLQAQEYDYRARQLQARFAEPCNDAPGQVFWYRSPNSDTLSQALKDAHTPSGQHLAAQLYEDPPRPSFVAPAITQT